MHGLAPLAVRAALVATTADPAQTAAPAGTASESLQTSTPVRTQEAMTIDGRGDESVWKTAPVASGFVERTPGLGDAPPRRLTFQAAYDDLALYVLVDVELPGPPIVRTLRRDSWGVFSDDTVNIKIDPMRDRRTSYIMTINADGAQVDTLALDDGRVSIRGWDGVWRAEVDKREDGFSAEFRIPFYMLGLRASEIPAMGFNISIDDTRRNATYDWQLIRPPASPTAASTFGELRGLTGIAGGRALEFIPYALARTDFTRSFTVDPRRRPNLAAGGEARLQLGAGSYVEASVLTDFAQVEADEVQVARDRFPLFFPERRPFFINGLDVFNFGRDREAQLFFSRRVGLDPGGNTIPLLGGVKAYGRTRRLNWGILNVQSMRGLPPASATPEEAEAYDERPPVNYTVGRVRVQPTPHVAIGVIGLGQHEFEHTDAQHFAGGLDAELRFFGSDLRWYGFVAGTFNRYAAQDAETDPDSGELTQEAEPEEAASGSSAYQVIEYRGLYVRPSAMWLWSDSKFDARMGFYRRPATGKQVARLLFAPRPQVLGLRDIVFGPVVTLTTDEGYDRVLTREFQSQLALNWRNGSRLRYSLVSFADDVQNAFTLYGYEVAARLYSGLRHRVEVESPGRKAVRVQGAYEYLDLFGGHAHQTSVDLTLRPSKHVSILGRYTHLVGDLANVGQDPRPFNFGFANATVEVAMTRNLIWDTLLRFSLAPGGERVGVQSRLRWRFMPGSDLYLVYRTDQPVYMDPGTTPFHELTLKATIYVRALLGAGARRRRRATKGRRQPP